MMTTPCLEVFLFGILMETTDKKWDVFISHASEDKDTFVRPLAISLRQLGMSVWFDEFTLKPGDSLSKSIDKGLSESNYGLVILSPHFLIKPWPEYELRGLVSREIEEDRVIIPIWHGINRQQVLKFSNTLADKIAINTEKTNAEDVAIQVLRIIRPDLYHRHSRSKIEKLASGEALAELQEEIDRAQDEIEELKGELSEFRCPHCNSPLIQRVDAPADPNYDVWDTVDVYECGLQVFGAMPEKLCPKDPNFPKLEEYDIKYYDTSQKGPERWHCVAIPKTEMAKKMKLEWGRGETKQKAKESLMMQYNRYLGKFKEDD